MTNNLVISIIIPIFVETIKNHNMNTSEKTNENMVQTLLGTIFLLTITTNDGYSESIVVFDKEEETIKKAISQIYTDNYIDSNCVDWKYTQGIDENLCAYVNIF